MTLPDTQHEKQFQKKGYQFIAGVDEVGRGCLAGPVVAGAVIFDLADIPPGLNDSKRLTAGKREKFVKEIQGRALAYAVAQAEVDEIDSVNILNASKLAMIRAIQKLQVTPDFLLIDGNFSIDFALPQRSVVKGDQISVSIAAASIIAKVYRDHLMASMDNVYPGYDFARHKGYGSQAHRKALQSQGMSPIHRKTFRWTPV